MSTVPFFKAIARCPFRPVFKLPVGLNVWAVADKETTIRPITVIVVGTVFEREKRLRYKESLL